MNVGNILEKEDLVTKVTALLEDEKRERERMRVVEEMEEMERVQRHMERDGVDIGGRMSSSTTRDGAGFQQGGQAVNSEYPSDTTVENGEEQINTQIPPASNIFMSAMERNGLCVVCQDDDANIAIVDCGYVKATHSFSFELITFFLIDTWRCVNPVPTSSCRPRKNVLCVERES